MKIGILFFCAVVVGYSNKRHRLKRQVLPSQHIKVHSIESKLSFNDSIIVDSSDSWIELTEKYVNTTIWSVKSNIKFNPYDTFVNGTAETAESKMNIQDCAYLHAGSLESSIFMNTNRSTDGQTYVNHQMYDNVNISLTIYGIRMQGIGGRRVSVEAQTWKRYIDRTMQLTSKVDTVTGSREIVLTVISPLFRLEVCLVGATVYIMLGDNIIEIDSDFTKANVYSKIYVVNFQTNGIENIQDVKLSNDSVRVLHGNMTVHVQPTGISTQFENWGKMTLERGGGVIKLGGNPINATLVNTKALAILLKLGNDGNVRADMSKSEIMMQTNIQNIGVTAAHQDLQVFGGVPHLFVESSAAVVEVSRNNGTTPDIQFIVPFQETDDQYKPIGIYNGSQNIPEISFPKPIQLNVTFSPLDGCGLSAIPKNQTMKSTTGTLTTTLPPTTFRYDTISYQSHTSRTTTNPPSLTKLFSTLISESPRSTTSSVPVTYSKKTTTKLPSTRILNEEDVNGSSSVVPTIPTLVNTINFTTRVMSTSMSTLDAGIGNITPDGQTKKSTSAPNSVLSSKSLSYQTYFTNLSLITTTPSTTSLITTTPSTTTSRTMIYTSRNTNNIYSPKANNSITTTFSDDFVIGHWFSTEESGEKRTTEVPEVGITSDIKHIAVTVQNNNGTPYVDFPTPLPLQHNMSIPKQPSLETDNTLNDMNMLILKMRVPDGVNVNSKEFLKNITMSMSRLVRDTRKKLNKRRRREVPYRETTSTEKSFKIEKIKKLQNVAEITFFVENYSEFSPEEVRKALQEVESKDLDQYFPYPVIEPISYFDADIKRGNFNRILLTFAIISVIALLLIIIVVFLFLNKNNKSVITRRMKRHFSKYTVPSTNNENAFERN